ncbi:uncharacterized protein LOC121367522 [Gigantopelta aegis]|uniref:uncharacterized protein LOC121367522 n=1 Tax=Gigantopelta aegis TaxID=1735272 RepID=UPI001B889A81|nr:uncharacterized protein LOC121367522 [Gigantopelta aegis]
MTRKREYSPVGRQKKSKSQASVANTKHRRRNRMELAASSVNESGSKKLKTKTSTQGILIADAARSQEHEQSSKRIMTTRGKKTLGKIAMSTVVVKDKNIIKDSEELVSTVPEVKIGDNMHVNKLHSKRKANSRSTSLEAAVIEAKEGLSNKPLKAPLRTLSQSHKIRKQSANRKAAHRIVKKKLLGRKELKFIRNLKSYREQPSMVTRLNQVNVPKPKPRKRTLSGEYELLDENLLRKQLKHDESLLTSRSASPSSRSVVSLKKQKHKRILANIPKHTEEITELKNIAVTSMNRQRPTTTKGGAVTNEHASGHTSRIKTKPNLLKKLHRSDCPRHQENSKSSAPSRPRKIKPIMRKLQKIKMQSNKHVLVRKQKTKNTLNNEEPPVLFAEPQSSDSVDTLSVRESDDSVVTIVDNTTVISSPPPILEKAIDMLTPPLNVSTPSMDISVPIRKRGRPKLKVQTSVMEIEKTNESQTGYLEVPKRDQASVASSLLPVQGKAVTLPSDVLLPIKKKRGRPKVKVATAMESEKTSLTDDSKTNVLEPSLQLKSGGFSITTNNLSEPITGMPRKRGRPKLDVGLKHLKHGNKFKIKRRGGTYDFPGKKKQKQPVGKKSALFMAVNNVRAGKRKPKCKRVKDVLNSVSSDSDFDCQTISQQMTNNTLIESIEDLSPIQNLGKPVISGRSDHSLEDSAHNSTVNNPVLGEEIKPSSMKDSDSESDLDDLPLISFIKKKRSKSFAAAQSVECSITSTDVSTVSTLSHVDPIPICEDHVLPKPALNPETKSCNSETISLVTCLVSSSGDAAFPLPDKSPSADVTSDSKDVTELSGNSDSSQVVLDVNMELAESTVSSDSKLLESLPLTSSVSLFKEIKQAISDETLSQQPGVNKIQLASVDDSEAKLLSNFKALSTTDSSDGINKLEDANNNPGDVHTDSPLVVCNSDGKVDVPVDDVQCPFAVDGKPDTNESENGKNKQTSLPQEANADFATIKASDGSVGTNNDASGTLNHKNDDDDVFESETVILKPQSQDYSEKINTTFQTAEQTTGFVSNNVCNETSESVSTDACIEKSAEDSKSSHKEEENTSETPIFSCDNSFVVSETVSTIDHNDTISVDMDAESTRDVEKARISTEATGLKVTLTRNKGNYKISGHSQSTGSESDECVPLLAQKKVLKPGLSNIVTDEEHDVIKKSPDASATTSNVAFEEQNSFTGDLSDSDNRKVPPLTIKIKAGVTKPVRQFALRPKVTRSPIEIIAMKQRKIEEEYQQYEAYKLARRHEKQMNKQKLLHQAKGSAETKAPSQSLVHSSKIDKLLAHCKPCYVTLVDFVKQLKLGKPLTENDSTNTSLVSQFDEQRTKGIKLKIKNISKQPKIVGKRGRPPKLKPKQVVSAPPVVSQLASDISDENEKHINELNEDGFAGSFVEFLKKTTDSNKLLKPSTVHKDSSQVITQQSSHTILKGDSKYPLSDNKDVMMESKNLENHNVSPTKYCCKTCDFTTSVRQTMEMHVYRHIPGISFKCGYCESDFASMASASAHAKNEHVGEESKILKSKEVIEADHYVIAESMSNQEKDTSQTAGGQSTADETSAPVVINVVVKGNVALTAPGYSIPSKRFICTHCRYSTNVKDDISQHVHDIHGSDQVYICTLCSDSFYSSEQEVVDHCSSTHPSRPCPYRQLPSYYDMEQLKEVQKMKQDDRGNIFERMTHLFQASPSVDENQPDEVVREQHYHRAREFLYIQEGWMSKTSAEADSTTRDMENVMDTENLMDTGVQKDADVEEEHHLSLEQPTVPIAVPGTDDVESLKTVDTAEDLVYQEPQNADDDESGISELKIIEVVSLRDKPDIIDENMSESHVDTTEPICQHTEQSVSEDVVKVTEPTSHRREFSKRHKARSSSSVSSRSSNLPEIDVDAIVQRNERLTCTYKCQKCNIHSPYLSAMVEHLKNHHTDIELFTCPYCKGSRGKRPQFSSELNVHEHVKMVHPTNFAKNEVSLSDAAKEFVQVIAIPSGAECSKVGNTFVIEKDIYMCLRCQAHMPSLDYTFSHLEREHTEVFVYVCPYCKVFKDKTDDVVFKHISVVHNQNVIDESLPLAIEDNLFLRVPSISKSGSYSERALGSKKSNQKANKDKPTSATFEKESQVKKVSTEICSAAENEVNESSKPLQQEVNVSAGSSFSPIAKQPKRHNKHLNTDRVNPRKQADPTHALMMDCENIDDSVDSADDTDGICNEGVQVISSDSSISVFSSSVTTVQESVSSNAGLLNCVEGKGPADAISSSLSSLDATPDRTHGTPSPSNTIKNTHVPLNRVSSISQCTPRRKSSIYSIADRLHRLHAQNKAGEKSVSSGDCNNSSSPAPIPRAVLKVPSVPGRNTVSVANPQISISQPLSTSGSVTSSALSSLSGVQRNKSLLFSNCPLDLSGNPVTQTTTSAIQQSTTTVASQPPVSSDEELRPESFQIFNLKPKRKTDSPQILPARTIPQQTVSPQAHVPAATLLSSAQSVPSLQTIHHAYPLAHLTPMPFQQLPLRFGLGIQNFIATGQPTLITLRPPLMGPTVVQDPMNYQRMPVTQQALQVQQHQTVRVPKSHTTNSLQSSSGHGTLGVDAKSTQLNAKHQRPPSNTATVSQQPKCQSPGFATNTVRQQLLQQADFYCPYCSEFRPLREYEVLPHIQRSHPRKEVLYLRRDKI